MNSMALCMMGRSTSTNLLLYHDYLNSAIENGSQIDAIFADFKKAFDNVDQVILLSKLSSFGIRGSLLERISSFITDSKKLFKHSKFLLYADDLKIFRQVDTVENALYF